MGDAMSSLIAIGLWLGSLSIWCYGVAVCWKSAEYFWAVFSFAMPPVGFLIGIYNLIF